MAISSTVRKAGPFTGNGIAAIFPFAFKVFAASDLIVVRTDSLGAAATLVLNTDYSVSLNVDQDANPGGDVTLATGLAIDNTLVISSDIPATQGTSIANLGGFYPKVIEDAFDKATILIQQMSRDIERSVQFPITDGPVTTEFPPAAARAGKLLGFSDDGSFALLPMSSFPGSWTYGETPAGTMNGINPTFTLTNAPPASGLILFWNSAKLAVNVGFTLSGNVITFQPGYIPQSGDTLEAYYPMPTVSLSFGQVDEHRDINHSGTETFSGHTTFSDIQASSVNGVIMVDGVKYPLTAAGIQNALNDASAAGGGLVMLPHAGTLPAYTGSNMVPTGTPIPMGNTTLVIPSNVVLRGRGKGNTILKWTAVPINVHNAAVSFPAGTQHAGIEDLTIDFISGLASGPVGVALDGSVGNLTALNNIRVNVNYESVTAGAAALFAPATLNSFSIILNTFDLETHLAAQAVVSQSTEGNFWKIQAYDSGNTSTVFQQVQANDEIIDARIESGSSGNGINGVCYSNTGQGCMVRMCADTGAAGWTAISDSPTASAGNQYIVSLIGTATLGTLSPYSSAIVIPAAGTGQIISPTFKSTVVTGTAPLTVASTTPVANLTASPATYDETGTQFAGAKIVTGAVLLSGGSATVTLTGAAVFTSLSNYQVVPVDGTAANAVKIVKTSGSQFVITGTGTDAIAWIAIGN